MSLTLDKNTVDYNALQFLLVDRDESRHIATIRLNRPDKLNAINIDLMSELVATLQAFDRDEAINAVVLTGNEKAFAAGADIDQMSKASAVYMYLLDQFAQWDKIRKFRKPLIAAINGFALGGGCELAMTCDMIVAGEGAKFGQPEINLGIIPGAGGTQRLTRAVGKAMAMELILTGRMFGAQEAKDIGLINKVVPDELVVEEAQKLAADIAAKGPVAARIAKESILKAFDSTVEGGLDYERKAFYLLFASEDQKEGMAAFLEKRKPDFKGQ